MSNPAMVSLVGAKRVHTQPIPNIIDARSRLQRSLEEYRRAEAHRTWPWQDRVSAKLPGMCSYAALPPQLKSDLASLTNFILDCTAHAIAEKQVVVLMRIVAAALSQLRQKPAAVTGDWQCTSCHSDVRVTKQRRPFVLCKPQWEAHLPESYIAQFGFLACLTN